MFLLITRFPTWTWPSGKSEGIFFGSVPNSSCAKELIARNMPRVTITALSGLRALSTGRMSTRSITAPARSEPAMDTAMAAPTGRPSSVSFHVQ